MTAARHGRSVFEHVKSRLAAAPIEEAPFPHLYAESAFPEDFYQEFLERLPDPTRYRKLSEASTLDVDYFEHRDQATLTDEWIQALPQAEQRSFFQDAAEWLLGEELRSFAVERFAPYVEGRFGLQREDWPALTTEAELIRHRARYCLEPHTDHPAKVVVMLFYLAREPGLERLGTSIYRPLAPDFVCEGGVLHPFKGFQAIRTMPYKPNAVFAFLKNDRSFHGVEPISTEDGQRTSRDIIEWAVYDEAARRRFNEKTA